MKPSGKLLQDMSDHASPCMRIFSGTTAGTQALSEGAVTPTATSTFFACHTFPTQGMSLPSGSLSLSLSGLSLSGGG